MQYTKAIVELLQPLNYGLPYLIYGIIKAKRWLRLSINTRQVLRGSYFYLISFIL